MRWILKFGLFFVAFFAVAKFCKKQTGGFTISRISSHLSYDPRWDVAHTPDEEAFLRKITNQPYYFLGKGAQSFVFCSQDEKYVIKFFRHNHMSVPLWQRWSASSASKRHSKLSKDFSSYKIAYEMLKEETALLYLHLNKTTHLQCSLDLVDKLGIHHPIPLDQYEFLVQKKADLVYPALDTMMKGGRTDDAKVALSGLVHFLAYRSQQGIFDKDPDLNSNFGFIGTKTIQIDIGRFKFRPPQKDKNEIVRITDNLHQWLMMWYPELDTHLKSEIEKL